jgi:hypothetical protein
LLVWANCKNYINKAHARYKFSCDEEVNLPLYKNQLEHILLLGT